jgi:vacuolar-type H+-ATPase subunit H
VLDQANSKPNRLIEEARAAAARVQEQETQKAIAAAEQIIAKAREAAPQDHARMLAELKREIGHLVVETTARVTGKILTRKISGAWPRKPTGIWPPEPGPLKWPPRIPEYEDQQTGAGEAKQLFRTCLVNGVLDENRAGKPWWLRSCRQGRAVTWRS